MAIGQELDEFQRSNSKISEPNNKVLRKTIIPNPLIRLSQL